ncbi:MAG: ParB N-terminal domain-containing protein [Alphaproteobacteria bacterium]
MTAANAPTIFVPLNKLEVSDENVRKTHDKAIVEGLAVSLGSHGQRQPLTVIKKGKEYLVIDGGYRLAAFRKRAKDGDIKDSHLVECKLETDAERASEISLASNVMRANMHFIDEAEAFASLIDDKVPAADIASRFGKPVRYVEQRLKLAGLSKKAKKLSREGAINLSMAEALTITDNHKQMDEILSNNRLEHMDAGDIRRTLQREEVDTSDRRVAFVGLKAYEKAGGTVKKTDLFSDDDEAVIEQVGLLDELVKSKLDDIAEKVRGEGWKWVEVRSELSYADKSRFLQLKEEAKPLPAKKQNELERLQAEFKKLELAFNAQEDVDEDTGDKHARLDKVAAKIAKLEALQETFWPEDKLAVAGCIIHLDYNGVEIVRGLVKPEDKSQAKAAAKGDDAGGDDAGNSHEPAKPEFPNSLVEQLTAEKSAAITAELLNDVDAGLRALAYNFAAQVFYDGNSHDTALQITLNAESFEAVEGTKALAVIAEHQQAWLKKLPEDEADLRGWIADQTQDHLLMLLTFCTAVTLNAKLLKADALRHNPTARLRDAEAVAKALNLDMTRWFTPSADNYFGKLSRDQVLEDIRDFAPELFGHANACKTKGTVVGVAVEALEKRHEEGTQWLPKLLRAGEA